MSKLNCNIVKDLMPLYIDGVVSIETAEEIKNHIEQCDCCRKEYKSLTEKLVLPSNENIQRKNSQVLKGLKHKIKRKKIMVSLCSVVTTILVIFAGYMVYQNVDVVHDYFSPVNTIYMRNAGIDSWQQVFFDDKDYLEFDSIFCSQKVVNDANSDEGVEIRISDLNGKGIIDNLTIEPGEEINLNQLKRNVKYIVEVKTTADFFILKFI